MEDIIRKLVHRFKTNDPFEICKGLNINIRYAHFEDGTRGLYYRKMRRRFVVLHDDMSKIQQRFVCAHELGHDRLHPGISQFFIDERSFFAAGKLESQANKFAVQLVTCTNQPEPDESVETYLLRCSVPIELHKYFH